MITLISADLHFSAYSQDPIIEETKLPKRLHELINVLTQMANYAIENTIKTIIIAGDIFHNKSIIHSSAQSLFLDFVRHHKNIEWILLDGNHDLSSMTGDGVSALKSLDKDENVITIHDTTIIENIRFVPWNPKTMMKDIKDGQEEYLISHLGLNEGKLNSGLSIVSDIGLKDLKQYKQVFFGHYHTPQEVGNVYYVGSPIHHDKNDKNQEKRFLVFNSDTGEIQSIPTDGYSKFFEFEITEENKEEVLSEAKKLKLLGNEITIKRSEKIDIDEDEFNVIDCTEKDITNRGITSDMTSADKLRRYLEIKEIDESLRDKYLNAAMLIINRSQS